MEAWRCPHCGESIGVPGHVVFSPEFFPAYAFLPSHSSSSVRLRVAHRACLSCGHVAASVAPDELRRAIERFGHQLLKQHVKLLERGIYHDVPDIPEARQAADKVMEIDGLVLANDIIEAKRRYRDLTGKTWDDAHATIPHWAQFTRTRKLALFGWSPKGKLDDEEEFAHRTHPMHDHLLDG